MLFLTAVAESQLERLMRHYAEKQYEAAAYRLIEALEAASDKVESGHAIYFDAPRPYPLLKVYGFRWMLSHRYWIALDLKEPPQITGIYDATGDVPVIWVRTIQ